MTVEAALPKVAKLLLKSQDEMKEKKQEIEDAYDELRVRVDEPAEEAMQRVQEVYFTACLKPGFQDRSPYHALPERFVRAVRSPHRGLL